MHIIIIVKINLLKRNKEKRKRREENKRKAQQHRLGIMLGLADLIPDCWLQVSLHSEGPATGQLDQGFP
jgi:hypothetical protein